MNKGIKESESKLNVEYDWDFLKAQMIRMSKNKAKYPKYNWQKPMDIEELKDALFRHTLEVMSDNYLDDGDEFGHLSAIALNAMFIFNQKKKRKMRTKQEILEDFWEQFPQYKEMTPTYEDIRFEEEEIQEWNKFWINTIWANIVDYMNYNVETLKDLEKYIKLK